GSNVRPAGSPSQEEDEEEEACCGTANMAAPLEVIMSSDSGAQLWNCTVFDLHSGSSLLSYRGGNSSARTLTVLGRQYLLSAQLGKNFINVWEIQRKDQLQQKIVCPGVVTCLTASPDALFLAAGVAEAIYLWEVSTGKLLSILGRHYQDVTCLKFTDDSSHFVSGGKDNLALVWSLSSVIQLDLSHTPEPRHILSRHSLPITDLHCGLMGAQARVATASLDQTVKVWELSSGELLLSVLFDVEIMSVTFDPSEYFLFCGGSDGNIFQVSLCSQSLSRDKSFQSDSDGNQVFKGHRESTDLHVLANVTLTAVRNLVTCLSVSMDGTLLLSGSHDETVRLWDIQSKQSIRCLAHKGKPPQHTIILLDRRGLKLRADELPSMEDLYNQRCRKKATKIIKDPSHPASKQTVLPAAAVWPILNDEHKEGELSEDADPDDRLTLKNKLDQARSIHPSELREQYAGNQMMNADVTGQLTADGQSVCAAAGSKRGDLLRETTSQMSCDLILHHVCESGPVMNAVIVAAPANMFLPDSRPAIPLPRFSRHLNASEGDSGESGEVCVRPGLYTQEEEETYLQKADRLNLLMNAVTDKLSRLYSHVTEYVCVFQSVFGDGENTKVRVAELEEEVQTLKKVNKDLYDFSSQLLTKPT
ncbi:hypothetical protein L3Q82_026149, partial [Scortum barcoo]